jgi:uncharacterized protein (TIGR00255 family)
MTGYGRASAEAEGLRVQVELRGVNHKGLDLYISLPSVLLCHELACRQTLRESIGRGHVDLRATCEFVGEQAVEVRYAEGAAVALGKLAARLKEAGVLAQGMTLGDLLSLPGAVQVGLRPELEERAGDLLRQALSQALQELVRTRRQEGERIRSQFQTAAAALETLAEEAGELQDRQLAEVREALAQRVRQMGVPVEAARLEQETVLAAERSDVAEEVVRLKAHVAALVHLLDSGPREMGKRLDHLLQEFQREVSTLLAKSSLMELTQRGLEMRLLVEQLREQALNVA